MLKLFDSKLQFAFEQYCIWKSIPVHFHYLVEGSADLAGFDDNVRELVKLQTKDAFCEKYGVPRENIYLWEKHPDFEALMRASWKAWARSKTPNVINKLYEKIMEDGDAPRIKVWAQLVEDQQEKSTINIDLGISRVKEAMREDGELPGRPPELPSPSTTPPPSSTV